MTDAEITLEPEGLREKFVEILAPAIDARAPYARFMIDQLVEVALSRSTLPREGQVEGWRLVPEEPTAAMIGAGILAYDGKCESSYAAMIDAAPLSPSPAVQDGDGVVEAPRETREALTHYACHGGPDMPCARTPDQCQTECGKVAGDALLVADRALSTQEQGNG